MLCDVPAAIAGDHDGGDAWADNVRPLPMKLDVGLADNTELGLMTARTREADPLALQGVNYLM